MRQAIGHWIAAAFCAVISYMAMIALISSTTSWGTLTFFGLLPMCFFFVGLATWQMHCEIRALAKQVAELREKVGVVPCAVNEGTGRHAGQFTLAAILCGISIFGVALALILTIVREGRRGINPPTAPILHFRRTGLR
jgi:hypothetical protein